MVLERPDQARSETDIEEIDMRPGDWFYSEQHKEPCHDKSKGRDTDKTRVELQ